VKAREKLRSKNLDWIVLNSPRALGGEEGSYILLGQSAHPEHLGRITKRKLASLLLEKIENSLKESSLGSDKKR
jgi:phosphopantothenoylcysteine synthetase/decarboxylase